MFLSASNKGDEEHPHAASLLGSSGENGEIETRHQKVAVLSIHPPDRIVGALCKVDGPDEGGNRGRIQAHPASLCLVGGLRARVQEFCRREGAAHGGSRRYHVGLIGSYLLLSAAALPLLVNDASWFRSFHLLAWVAVAFGVTYLAERAHRTSARYLDSERDFRAAWERSGLEDELAAALAGCGHSLAVDRGERVWKLSVFRRERAEGFSPLPPPPAGEGAAIDESTRKLFGFCTRVGMIECGRDAGERPSPDDPPALLDLWTMNGLLLGHQLNNMDLATRSRQFASAMALGLFCTWPFISLALDNFTKGFFVAYLVIAAIVLAQIAFLATAVQTFREYVDMPKVHAANDAMARRLAPLVRDRHGGLILSYYVRPATGRRLFRCWKRGVFVLKEPARASGCYANV